MDKSEIFALALTKASQPETNDPFDIIAELITDLQGRIATLEERVAKYSDQSERMALALKARTKKVTHIRDPHTHQIISSIIEEE